MWRAAIGVVTGSGIAPSPQRVQDLLGRSRAPLVGLLEAAQDGRVQRVAIARAELVLFVVDIREPVETQVARIRKEFSL